MVSKSQYFGNYILGITLVWLKQSCDVGFEHKMQRAETDNLIHGLFDVLITLPNHSYRNSYH